MRTDPPTTQTIARFLLQALLGVGVWTMCSCCIK